MKKNSMKPFSKDIGVIHFIGIGGIGMSGIAEILCNLGYKICLLYTSPSPRDATLSRMPSSA